MVPPDALVAGLGSGRDAIYRMLFDARRKLRAALVRTAVWGPGTSGRS
jgi:RNA polymerase sigma-70 factor (ECF subfamily)